MVGSWPTRRDQPVSVALSPAGDRLALSVGQRLSVSDITDGSRVEPRLERACALAPGFTWSPDGDKLAFRDDDGLGRLLELAEPVSAPGAETRMAALGPANAMAFAPDGDRLAVLAPSSPGRVTLMLIEPNQEVIWQRVLTRNRLSSYHPEGVNLAWSPDGSLLACTTGTSTVWMFDTATGQPVREFDDHSRTVTGLSWIDDERIVSASTDATLRVWGPGDAASLMVVETIAAAGMVYVRERETALIWSASGELLAWSLAGTPAQLWYREPPSRSVAAHFARLAVSAVDGLLALVDAGATELVLVSDWDRVPSAPAVTTTYANAKVLLLGDSGVGKSGLAMVLAGEEFRPTESSHGRRIWRLPATEEADSSRDNREVLLWDLAGQPGYRIVHQLHLEGSALALILFDAKSETAPLAGVQHWARAVHHAHPATAGGLTTFLVAARADRGGINVSDQRIQKLMADFALDDYFKTSAKEATSTDLLRARLLAAIDWARIPEVTSTALFAADFAVPSTDRVLGERQERLLVLATLEELQQHELAVREPTEDGVQLVFPSACRRDLPDSETPQGDGVVFRFEGPIENVYATFSGSVTRERQYSCPDDGTAFTPEQVRQVIRRGRPSIMCPVCENRIPLREDDKPVNGADRSSAAMGASADAEREIAVASSVLRGKEEVAEFDVFISYNWEDKAAVRKIAQQLRDRGLRPWLDERELGSGLPWQPMLEDVIAGIPAAAVIVGSQVGPWQQQEVAAILRQSVRRACAVVPVLLPGANPQDLPVFLGGLTWVDLTATEPDPIDQLVWGITGKHLNR
jgi:GTPase SAR1 family protein